METERMDISTDSHGFSNEKNFESQVVLKEQVTSFLKQHNGYEMMPVSYRLTVLDSELLLSKALAALVQNGEEIAPIWNSENQCYDGIMAVTNLVNIIQYYYANFSYSEAMEDINNIKLKGFNDFLFRNDPLSNAITRNSPMESLHKISKNLLAASSRAITLVDTDSNTGSDVIAATLNIYQILQFLIANFTEKKVMRSCSLYELGIGTYTNLITATMNTPVIDVVGLFVEHNISAVPIVDEKGELINAFARSDMTYIIKEFMLEDLTISIQQAIDYRHSDFPGVHTCKKDDNLLSILSALRNTQIQRFIVVDEKAKPEGIITLRDILKAIIL
ncbi:hypothetical protein BB559_000077 [Furculomyces boomerangus]|uniref:CBS domain-containing protein n=2 Tax=Harpellales TaxID=61421 RepID=A0A2T9Z6E2_9FUNG|nr:hypothetical protein BB559_000077 [Furculomyces boomerangus]PWA00638.1 hypothetical protein BB558_003319 [Smittium angustum]